MLEDGLTYPKRGDWISRILIGGLLSIFSFLILPMFILYGYLLNVFESSYNEVEEPPEFEDWGSLLVRGLIAWLISIAYAIPIFLFTMVMIPFIGFGALQDDPAVFIAGGGLLWFLGTFILGILLAYILPAAFVNYARTNRAGAAFDFRTIVSIAFTMEYLMGIILAFVTVIIIGIVSALVSITIIGILAVPFISFYGYIALAYIMGTAARNAETA